MFSKSNIYPPRRQSRTWNRRDLRQQTTIYGCRPAGTGIRAGMSGDPVTGLWHRRAGSGRRRTTFARREVMFLSAGHWDYSLRRRGVLFAPVYFPRHYYERPGFSYSLSVVVDIGNLEFGLFTYPRYSHYYFGDYYDNVYIGIGIFPWYECRTRHSWYDPIYEHDRWRHHKVDRDWDNHERHEYDRRRDDRDLRTPRTYREMEQRLDKMPEAKRKDIRIAEPMDKVVADKKSPMKFEPIKTDARQKLSKESTDVRKFGDDRSRWESSPAPKKSGQPNIWNAEAHRRSRQSEKKRQLHLLNANNQLRRLPNNGDRRLLQLSVRP